MKVVCQKLENSQFFRFILLIVNITIAFSSKKLFMEQNYFFIELKGLVLERGSGTRLAKIFLSDQKGIRVPELVSIVNCLIGPLAISPEFQTKT